MTASRAVERPLVDPHPQGLAASVHLRRMDLRQASKAHRTSEMWRSPVTVLFHFYHLF